MAQIQRFPVAYRPDETLVEVAERLRSDGLVIDGCFHGPRPQIEAVQISTLSQTGRNAARVEAIKARAGAALICHPAYQPVPRHSVNPDVYRPARQAFLDGIAARARRDREKNPAFQRAEAMRKAIGS